MKQTKLQKMVLSAILIAIGMVLPFLTGQIPEIGNLLLPLHIPALVAGFVCGAPFGAMVGFILPILRSLVFGMPPLVPTSIAMAFEMATYGLVCGVLFDKLPTTIHNMKRIYIALVSALVLGRVVWGLVSIPLYAMFTSSSFALSAFWIGGFVNAWAGILLQLVLIPAIVVALQKAKFIAK